MLRIIATIGSIQALAIVVNVLRAKIMAVLLGPEGVGVVSIVDHLVQLLAHISAFSIPFAAVKFLSRSHSEGFDSFARTYHSFLTILVWVTSIGATISLGFLVFRSDLLSPELLKYRSLLILGCLAIPTMSLRGFLSNVFAAAQRPRASVAMAFIEAVVLLVATAIGISVGGLLGLYGGNLLVGILVVIGTIGYVHKTLHLPLFGQRARLFTDFLRSPDVATFCLQLYVLSFTFPFSLVAARYAVFKSFGEAETGLLQAAIALASSLSLVLGPANGLFLTPIMNRTMEKPAKMQRAFEFQRKLVVILSVAALPIVLFPRGMLTLLYAASFAPAAQYVPLFVMSECLLLLAGVHQASMIGFDDLRTHVIICLAGDLCRGAISWVLVPHYGIWGVAIAFLVAGATIFLLTAIRLGTAHGFSIPGNLGALIGYSVLTLILAGILFDSDIGWNRVALLLKTSFCLFFLSGLFLLLSKAERDWIYALWARVKLIGIRA